MPGVVTHTYDPHGVFLGNICDLPSDEAELVLCRFRDAGARLKANYLARRLATEDWLIAERHKLLGRTPRERPVYFFLGNFADGEDASRPSSLVMPLAVFPQDAVTFTYPDSMASLPIGTREDLRSERRPYHGKVFSLLEIREVIADFGMPRGGWPTGDERRHDRFVEMQVWDDRPIMEFMADRTSPHEFEVSHQRQPQQRA